MTDSERSSCLAFSIPPAASQPPPFTQGRLWEIAAPLVISSKREGRIEKSSHLHIAKIPPFATAQSG